MKLISMLRGINVGHQNQIRMAELKSLYESLGFSSVQTYVQSGNVVFESSDHNQNAATSIIEAALEQKYGSQIPVLIRTVEDFQHLIDANPFTHGRSEDRTKLHVTFLYRRPSEENIAKITGFKDPIDEFFLEDMEVFLFCPNGYGRTKLSNTFFEKKLAVAATTRNWNTVTTLLELAQRD